MTVFTSQNWVPAHGRRPRADTQYCHPVLSPRLSPTTLPVFLRTVRLAVVRAVRPLDCIIESSNAEK